MFKLVKFEDGKYHVCAKNKVTSEKGAECVVKYTNGIRYKAVMLTSSDDPKYLDALKEEKQVSNVSKELKVIMKKLTVELPRRSFKSPVEKAAEMPPRSEEKISEAVTVTSSYDPKYLNALKQKKEFSDVSKESNVIKKKLKAKLPKRLFKNPVEKAAEVPPRSEEKISETVMLTSSDDPKYLNALKQEKGVSDVPTELNVIKKKLTAKLPRRLFKNPVEKAAEVPPRSEEKISETVMLTSSDDPKYLNALKQEKRVSDVPKESNVIKKKLTAKLPRRLFKNPVEKAAEVPPSSEKKNSVYLDETWNDQSTHTNLDETLNTPPDSSTPNAEDSTQFQIRKHPVIISDILISKPTHETWNVDTHVSRKSYDVNETHISGTDVSHDSTANKTFPSILSDVDPSNSLTIDNMSLGTIDALVSVCTFDKMEVNESTDTNLMNPLATYDDPAINIIKNNEILALTSNPPGKIITTVHNENDTLNESDSASEYIPSEKASLDEHPEQEDDNEEAGELNNSQYGAKKHIDMQRPSLNSPNRTKSPKVPVRDDADMYVNTSDGKKGHNKKLYCKFCSTFQLKFARHLETVHKDLPDVKAFSLLPKGNPERKKRIEIIRKKCQFYFNTRSDVNTGELIVTRRPQAKFARKAGHFKVCPNCKGFFSQGNYRHHANKCFGYNGKDVRTLSIMGCKLISRIHSDASEDLKETFSILREDNVTRLIRYDRLVILYGNKLCRKYRHQHQHDMIRAYLRLLGRFLTQLKQINADVIDFTTIYDPKFYDDVIKAINIVAKFDKKKNIYGAPSTAYSLGSMIKKVGNLLITDCIKRHDATQKSNTEDFLKLLVEDIGVTVNKTVAETQSQVKRRKKTELPTFSDIQKFHTFLQERRAKALQSLKKEFSIGVWMALAEFTLTSVQVFNRRRAGEIERMYIEDFKSFERMSSDLYKSLSPKAQEIAKKYIRFVIRGKLNRTVPVLLPAELLECIEIILKHRQEALVPVDNPYVFGIPGFDNKRFKYLRSCVLMRKFAKECGAQFPDKLRGTKLRKHIATNCINLNLSENEIADVANFMGHAEKIHKEHYRQPILSREILRMSRVLELAQGGEECDQDDSDDSDDNNAIRKFHKNSIESETCSASFTQQASIETSSDSSEVNAYDSKTEKRDQKYMKSKKQVRKRSTSPYGTVGSKRRWTSEEKNTAWKLFGKNINDQSYPSLKAIQRMKLKHCCLADRSPTVIKVWISNQIKKQKKHELIGGGS